MNHRFVINIDLAEGVTIKETGRPITPDQLVAITCSALVDRIQEVCTSPQFHGFGIDVVTEAAPAPEEGGAK